jgi:predicted MFS family arabinose efflux permease
MVRVLAAGVTAFAFAATGASIPLLAAAFTLAGIGIGCAATAEHAAVARHPRAAFGVLAAAQSFGNLIASAGAGVIYTLVSPAAAFTAAAVLMAVSLIVLTASRGRRGIAAMAMRARQLDGGSPARPGTIPA